MTRKQGAQPPWAAQAAEQVAAAERLKDPTQSLDDQWYDIQLDTGKAYFLLLEGFNGIRRGRIGQSPSFSLGGGGRGGRGGDDSDDDGVGGVGIRGVVFDDGGKRMGGGALQL